MDILGSTTPSALIAAAASGIATTGASIWPLFVLIGVPIAFVVYGYVVGAAKHTVGGEDKGLGYFHGTGEGKPLERYEDQKLGEMEYDVQTFGMWPRPPKE